MNIFTDSTISMASNIMSNDLTISRNDRTIAIGRDVQHSIINTGDNNIIINLIAGIHELSIDYATRIENFLRAYLQLPMPFGGRNDEITHLNRWLNNPKAPPRLILTAPAGRAKSTLLVHWLSSLNQSTLTTVFVPISIRYNTNSARVTFAALAARLAQVHNDVVPTDINTSDDAWKDLAISYLRRPLPDNKSLLVVLDGLDEAANWDVDAGLFPSSLPENVRLIVSARLTHDRSKPIVWREVLGWEYLPTECVELQPLSQSGISDVLTKAGISHSLFDNSDLIAELHHVTEGVPLLIRLHVQDILQLDLTDTKFTLSHKTGYEGFFERWWEDQRRLWGKKSPMQEIAVQEVLNLLAVPAGPLTKDDLLTLASPDIKITTWHLEKALRPLSRFVIQESNGYIFAHLRLGEYFYSRLGDKKRNALNDRILDWIRQSLDALVCGAYTPNQIPAYIVCYATAHFYRSKQGIQSYLPLINTRFWADAWHVQEGPYGNYLADIYRVWKEAHYKNIAACTENKNAPYLLIEIQCALIAASIRSVAANLPPEFVLALLKSQVWTPAQSLSYALQIPEPYQRNIALVKLFPHLPRELQSQILTDHPHIKNQLSSINSRHYSRSTKTSLHMDDISGLNNKDLIEIAPYFTSQQMSEALVIAERISTSYHRSSLLTALGPYLPFELIPQALDIARQFKEELYRARVLAAFASRLAELGDTNQALAIAREINNKQYQVMALTSLIPFLPPDKIDQTLTIIQQLECSDTFRIIISRIASTLPISSLHQILTLTQNINDQEELERTDHALKIYQIIKNGYSTLEDASLSGHEIVYTDPIIALATCLEENIRVQVLNIVYTNRKRNEQLRSIRNIICASYLLEQIFTIVQSIENESLKSKALIALVDIVANEIPVSIFTALQKISDRNIQSLVLTKIIPFMPTHLLRHVITIAQNIQRDGDRGKLLMALAHNSSVSPSLASQIVVLQRPLKTPLPE